jgi:NADH dehydrogenase
MLKTKNNSKSVKRIVILGAGSAGISTALSLKRAASRLSQIEVVLLDQKNYHAVLPLIYQVVNGSVSPNHISFPLRKLFRKRWGAESVTFRQGHINGIDVDKKLVITEKGELSWDYLVMALGSTTNFFGMADVEEVALTFRSLKDGIAIQNRILDNYEAALWAPDEQTRQELLTFTIVGGGPTGVELSAHIREYTGRVLAKYYPSLSKNVRVILVEAQDIVLPGMKEKTRELAMSKLKSRGVEIMLKTRLSKAWNGGVQTADGDIIPTRAVIWCAGIKPISIIKTLPFDKAKDGRIIINNYLQVPGTSGVYALGDCAYLEQEGGLGPYPPTFQVAYRQGRVCARNIINAIKGKPAHPYRSRFLGQVFYIDRNTAVAQLFGRVFDGYLAGIMRRALFIGMLIYYGGPLTGLKNKLSAALDWSFAYFYNRNVARL